MTEGLEPRSVVVRPARWGYRWRMELWSHAAGERFYVGGWRPTSQGAVRRGRRAFERAECKFDRLNAWGKVEGLG